MSFKRKNSLDVGVISETPEKQADERPKSYDIKNCKQATQVKCPTRMAKILGMSKSIYYRLGLKLNLQNKDKNQ